MSDYVANLQKDLRKKLDHLCWIHYEPALHISKHFTALRNKVDFDAEVLLSNYTDSNNKKKIIEMNERRMEFIRILFDLQTRLLDKNAIDCFESSADTLHSFGQRVDAFNNSSLCSLEEMEETYMQLAREIISKTDQLEKRVFCDQTIIHWPSSDTARLGSLVYFGDMFLNHTEIDYLLSVAFPKTHQSAANSLLVTPSPCFNISKKQLAIKSLTEHHLFRFAEVSKFWYIGKSESEYTGYSAEDLNVRREFISYQFRLKSELAVLGDVELDIRENLFEVFRSSSLGLSVVNRRLNGAYANLLPSSVDSLTSLKFKCVHLDSFETNILTRYTNLRQLELGVTFSENVNFHLGFLKNMLRLETLELTLPHSRQDFGVLKELIELTNLHLRGCPINLATHVSTLSAECLEQILSPPCLESLALSRFNIEALESNTLNRCKCLTNLKLNKNRINYIAPNTFQNLRGILTQVSIISCEIVQGCFEVFGLQNYVRNLIMIDTPVKSLSRNSFKGLAHLCHLNLSNNSISELSSGIFDSLDMLEELSLTNNNIRQITNGVFNKLERLTILNLNFNPIESIEAKAFSKLIGLITLSLMGCRLKSIDSEMFKCLISLRELNLSNNLIERIEVVARKGRRFNASKVDLSEEERHLMSTHLFKDLSSLFELKLSGNRLKKLQLGMFCNLKKLSYLDLSYNQLNELNEAKRPENLPPLDYLILSNNCLTTISIFTLPKQISSIDLSHNKLRQLDIEFFTNFTRLSSLNLCENQLSFAEVRKTFARFRRAYYLFHHEWNVFNGEMEQAAWQMRFVFECDYKGLLVDDQNSLTLRINKLTPEVTQALKSSCKESIDPSILWTSLYGCEIQELTRNLDWESENDPAQTIRLNLSLLPNSSHVIQLDFSRNLILNLKDSELFADFVNLRTLNFSGNRLEHIHRDILKSMPYLESIDLSENMLSSVDLGLFRSSVGLTQLDLSSNNISFINLAKLFRNCPKLQSINLANNQLKDNSTAEPIAETSSFNMRILNLSNNQLKRMDFVRDMTNLKQLNLRGNKIASALCNEYKILGRLEQLTLIDLS